VGVVLDPGVGQVDQEWWLLSLAGQFDSSGTKGGVGSDDPPTHCCRNPLGQGGEITLNGEIEIAT
jgi:hypothetical protein